MCMCVSCICCPCAGRYLGGLKRVSDALGLQLQEAMNNLVWVLGTQLGSSSIPNY